MFWEETDHVLEAQTSISFLVLLLESTYFQSRVKGNVAVDPFLVNVSNLLVGILLAKKPRQGNFPLVTVWLAGFGKDSGELVVSSPWVAEWILRADRQNDIAVAPETNSLLARFGD
ncbi:hypothetical protein IQ218_10180 [Synechocystis salina LEGE 06099]|uniref:hypothetical protein n=1 Tax=Synechocystis salina TaxID=945780 RepID=UPI00187EE5AF|nr:hypothetical protein [Synechocystis salina]MBE9203735.1 hypothetical protein [Synechocystis salina LEGE 06099]